MKPTKLKQITRVREAVRHLRKTAHADSCPCCTADLDLIETAADSVCAETWLRQVAKRIEQSRELATAARTAARRRVEDHEA